MNRRAPILIAALVALGAVAILSAVPAAATGTKLFTTMSGAEEAPGPGDPDATGEALIRLNQGAGTVCYRLSWSDIDGTVTASHIHKAPAGSPGGIVVPLFVNESFAGTDSDSGCTTGVDSGLIKDIRKNPQDYYVNVHSTVFPPGAIRGQLGD
ncbi:MAG: CHRD domain-containing protein [Actinomycetota bacterium]|nr:CHRD domain-containing protein [Actinomycetota bacterium]